MILTVTPNAALDITYEVDELVAHQSHRVTTVRQRAGGKGVNVASVLARMGRPVIATGLVGGSAGDEIRSDLEARGVAARFVDGGGSSRRTVNVVSTAHGDATIFNEPGPELTGPGWQSLVAGLDSLLAAKLRTRLREELNLRVDTKELLLARPFAEVTDELYDRAQCDSGPRP